MSQTITPTAEQMQRAKWDQMLADTERKRQEYRFAPWQLFFGGMLAASAIIATLFTAGAMWLPRQPQTITVRFEQPFVVKLQPGGVAP